MGESDPQMRTVGQEQKRLGRRLTGVEDRPPRSSRCPVEPTDTDLSGTTTGRGCPEVTAKSSPDHTRTKRSQDDEKIKAMTRATTKGSTTLGSWNEINYSICGVMV